MTPAERSLYAAAYAAFCARDGRSPARGDVAFEAAGWATQVVYGFRQLPTVRQGGFGPESTLRDEALELFQEFKS